MVDLNKGATVELVKTLSDDIRTLPDGTKAASAGDAVRESVAIVEQMKTNLFTPGKFKIQALYVVTVGGVRIYGTKNNTYTLIYPCKPSTKYTIMQDIKSERFTVSTSTDEPAYSVAVNKLVTTNYQSPCIFITGSKDYYIAIRFYDSDFDTDTYDNHLNSIMIAEGEVSEFIPWYKPIVRTDLLDKYILKAIQSEKIYGIKINTNGNVERVADAVGLQNDYLIGTAYQHGGKNDFDDIYPWSEMKTCNISENADGDKVITYAGEVTFSRDGSNGDVFVEIPRFYTKRYFDDDRNEIILISRQKYADFITEPAFFDSVTGEEIDHIYVGAYLTQTGVDRFNSVSGVFPESNLSMNDFKLKSGEMYDFVTLQAVQKLMSIEFGCVNFSEIFGGLSDLPWSTSCVAEETVAGVNTANFKGDYRINNLQVGSVISVNSTIGIVENRVITAITDSTYTSEDNKYHRQVTFTGSPVNIEKNVTAMYCTGQKSGLTDVLQYHTGRRNGNSFSTLSNQFKYRDIEGLWGNLGEMLDGVIVSDLKAYWSNIKTNYGDITKCKRLNFAMPLQNTYYSSQNALPSEIQKMGWDFRYPTVMLPHLLAQFSGDYYGDQFFSIQNTGPEGQSYPDGTLFTAVSSMAWDGKGYNGLYTLRFWTRSTDRSWLYGSRAIIRNL